MKLDALKKYLKEQDHISFQLPDGQLVPSHFHVTEVGKIIKDFIDCGGTRRSETKVNFQLWEANDYDHRLHPEKLIHIIELSQKELDIGNLDIEVEYQGSTIGKYGLEIGSDTLLLTTKATACLANEQCGPNDMTHDLSDMTASSCNPNSNCC